MENLVHYLLNYSMFNEKLCPLTIRCLMGYIFHCAGNLTYFYVCAPQRTYNIEFVSIN